MRLISTQLPEGKTIDEAAGMILSDYYEVVEESIEVTDYSSGSRSRSYYDPDEPAYLQFSAEFKVPMSDGDEGSAVWNPNNMKLILDNSNINKAMDSNYKLRQRVSSTIAEAMDISADYENIYYEDSEIKGGELYIYLTATVYEGEAASEIAGRASSKPKSYREPADPDTYGDMLHDQVQSGDITPQQAQGMMQRFNQRQRQNRENWTK